MEARLLLLGALLAASVVPTGGAEGLVHVRIEGAEAFVWDGWIALPDSFMITATSVKNYTLDGPTPLAALVEAATVGGFRIEVSDEFVDFKVLAIDGEAHWNTAWWDYRVDWVATNYGEQEQWRAWGESAHPIVEDARVLWYVDHHLSLPLRMTDGPALGAGGGCARAEYVEAPGTDEMHQPGTTWPELVWRPVELARFDGAAEGHVVAGTGVAVVDSSGWLWADWPDLAADVAYRYVRSERTWLDCDGAA